MVLRCRKVKTIQSGIHCDDSEQYCEKMNIEILPGEDSDEVVFELVKDGLHCEGILALNLALV